MFHCYFAMSDSFHLSFASICFFFVQFRHKAQKHIHKITKCCECIFTTTIFNFPRANTHSNTQKYERGFYIKLQPSPSLECYGMRLHSLFACVFLFRSLEQENVTNWQQQHNSKTLTQILFTTFNLFTLLPKNDSIIPTQLSVLR